VDWKTEKGLGDNIKMDFREIDEMDQDHIHSQALVLAVLNLWVLLPE
jgi:hypothetical protein